MNHYPHTFIEDPRTRLLRRVLLCLAWLIVCLVCLGAIYMRLDATKPPPPSNGSSDGRYHTCGYVTEDGVTEYLAAYKARCGSNP